MQLEAPNLHPSLIHAYGNVYELNCIDQESINIFGLKAINKVSLFHRYSNGPINAFMKNRSDFFILFQFCQKNYFIVEFVSFGPS